MTEKTKLNTIEEAVEDFRRGEFVIVVDDEDRENEGDLIVAAEKITAEKVNFMLKHARGVLCAPITLERCKELDLPHQVQDNTSVLGTPFTVTVDKLEGCTTASLPTTALRPSRHWPTRRRSRRPSADQDISARFTHKTTVCCAEADILKPPSTSVTWPGSILPAPLWRS